MKSKQLTNIRAAGKDVRPVSHPFPSRLLADVRAGDYQAGASQGADPGGLHSVRVRVCRCRRYSRRCFCSYIADDELVEVTPKIVRLRKKKLDPTERKKLVRQTL